jgi:hypothetical protein
MQLRFTNRMRLQPDLGEIWRILEEMREAASERKPADCAAYLRLLRGLRRSRAFIH